MGRNRDKGMKTENFSPRQALNKAFLRVKPNPTMVDIRDSGQIEEGADLILMLCGDEYYQNTSNQGIMAIIEDL